MNVVQTLLEVAMFFLFIIQEKSLFRGLIFGLKFYSVLLLREWLTPLSNSESVKIETPD